MRECNKEVRDSRENIEEESLETNVKCLGRFVIKIKERIISASKKEVVRKVDIITIEKECAKEKISCNTECVDLEARTAFPMNRATTSTIKCTNVHNQHRLRDAMMNKNIINSKYPRCSLPETKEIRRVF